MSHLIDTTGDVFHKWLNSEATCRCVRWHSLLQRALTVGSLRVALYILVCSELDRSKQEMASPPPRTGSRPHGKSESGSWCLGQECAYRGRPSRPLEASLHVSLEVNAGTLVLTCEHRAKARLSTAYEIVLTRRAHVLVYAG